MKLAEKISLIRKLPRPVKGVGSKMFLSLNVGSGLKIKRHPFVVRRVLNYQEMSKKGKLKSFMWREYELVDLVTFETRYLEVEDDDKLCFYMTSQKVPAGKLSESPDAQTRELSIAGDTETFYIDEVSYARFTDEATPEESEDVMMLDFESDSGERMLGVEVWGEAHCEAYFYYGLALSDMEVFAHESH